MTDYYSVKDSNAVELKIAAELIDEKLYPKFSYDTVSILAISSGIDPSVTYTAKDVIGNVFTFTDIARKVGLGGIIQSASVVINKDVAVPLRLILFESTVTVIDNSPLNLNVTQARTYIGSIDFEIWEDVGAAMVSSSTGIALGYKCVTSTNLYGVLVPQSDLFLDVDFPATGIVISLVANQD